MVSFPCFCGGLSQKNVSLFKNEVVKPQLADGVVWEGAGVEPEIVVNSPFKKKD